MILFADYCDQLTIVKRKDVKSNLPYYKCTNKEELFEALNRLTATNPWFYIECSNKMKKYL